MTRAYNTATTQQNSGGAVSGVTAGKNAVINGGMDIWQRGTSFSNPSNNAYLADRFINSVPTNTTISRQATGDTTNLPFIKYAMRVQRNSGATNTGTFYIGSPFEMEDCTRFIGKTITISFYARMGANYSATSNILNLKFFTGTNTTQGNGFVATYTGSVTAIDQNFTLTTSWQRFTKTVTLNSDITQFTFWFQHTTTGTAGAADYYDVTGVQIEEGSVATPFSRAGGTIQGELAACQRYYWRQNAATIYSYLSTWSPAYNTSTAYCRVVLPTTMRIAPTSLEYSTIGISDEVTFYSGGTITLDTQKTTDMIGIKYVHTTNALTQFRSYVVSANNSTSAYIALDAEL